MILVIIGFGLAVWGFYMLLFGGSKHSIEHTHTSAINGEVRHSG